MWATREEGTSCFLDGMWENESMTYFQWRQEKANPRAHRFRGGGAGGRGGLLDPRVGIFQSPLNISDGFYLSPLNISDGFYLC